MRKFLNHSAKKFLTITVCLLLCFSMAFLATGCLFSDPGYGDKDPGNVGGENVVTKYELTINANGGVILINNVRYSSYIIKGKANDTYRLEKPTYNGSSSSFIEWKLSANSQGKLETVNGAYIFTFGSGNATLTANWNNIGSAEQGEIGQTDISKISILTINANGGLYKGYSSYNISSNEGSKITLDTPTHPDGNVFDGWIKVDGTGSLDGSEFTFGNGDATVKAVWQGGLMEFDINDYMQGARFTYKIAPEKLKGTTYLENVKTQLDVLGVDVWSRLLNMYNSGTEKYVIDAQIGEHSGYKIEAIDNFNEMYTNYQNNGVDSLQVVKTWKSITDTYNIENSKSIESEVFKYKYHIQFLYVGVVSGMIEKQENANGTFSYVYTNKNGLNFESDLNYILTGSTETIEARYNEIIDNYAIYLDHTGLLNYEKDILADLILTQIIGEDIIANDSSYGSYDQFDGFNAELYFNNISKYSKNADFTFTDSNNNGVWDSGESFNATENYASLDELYFNNKPKFIDLDNDNKFDLWDKDVFISRGLCTEKTYNHSDYYYHLYQDSTGNLTMEFKAGNSNIDLSSVGKIENNTYMPNVSGIYDFDIRGYNFKNYKIHIQNIVNQIVNASYNDIEVYPVVPALMVQDLDNHQITADLESEDGTWFNQNIISNNSADYSMQSIILNIKKEMLLQNMVVFFEFIDEEVTSFNMNIKGRYYHNNQLIEFEIGDFSINSGEFDLVYGDSVELDFIDIAEKLNLNTEGLYLNTYNSVLNNGSVINTDSSYGKRTKEASELLNFEKCFTIEENKSKTGAVVQYSDTSSDYFEIVLDAEKINGVTPNYKVSIFSVDGAQYVSE